MQELDAELQETKDLRAELRTVTDGARAVEIVERLEKLRLANTGYIAFKASDVKKQHEMIFAASFSDEWSSVPGGALRSWYICRRKVGYDVCGHLMLSKTWDRKHAEATAAGQKFYCTVCGATYSTNAGCLVEVSRVNSRGNIDSFYGTATVPPWDLEDVRAAYIEKNGAPTTAAECFEMTKAVGPQENELISKHPSKAGVWKIADLDAVDALPKWDWWQLMGVPEPEKKQKKRRR